MVKQFDDECIVSAVKKYQGLWAPGQRKAATDWASHLVTRARRLEGDAISLPNRLHALLEQGRLVLAVGAGVSISCGMPQWTVLVRSVLLHALQSNELSGREGDGTLAATGFADDPIAIAQAMEILLDQESLLTAVAQCLYRKPLKQSALLRSVAELVAAAHKRAPMTGRPAIVLTFNYDMLVEETLTALHVPVRSWDRNVRLSKLSADTVHVVHVHGLLRRQPPHGTGIVLTETSYGEAYLRGSAADPISEMLEQGMAPLFVGFSFRDHYVRQLLHKQLLQKNDFVAACVAATEAFVEARQIVLASNRELGFSPNDEMGWTKTGQNPRDVRDEAVRRLPARLSRWILSSVGVEWYEVPKHADVCRALRCVATGDTG